MVSAWRRRRAVGHRRRTGRRAAAPRATILMHGPLFDAGDARGPDAAAARTRRSPSRMRPRTLDEVVGQRHLLGEGSALRTAIEPGRPHSMILYGPPGTGKTTLARHRRRRSADAAFEELSRRQRRQGRGPRGDRARGRAPRAAARATIFFLDEIHRFNKAQQDALLPAVEDGTRHAHRGDDREPVLRGQLGAALAHAGLRAARARARATSRSLLRRALERGECGASRVADEVDRVPRRPRRRRRAGRAQRARAGAARPPAPTGDGRHARGRRGRDAAQGGPLRQGAATSTTTSSRPGSSRRAARTPTPRSTTSRRCSRAARTRASSRGA